VDPIHGFAHALGSVAGEAHVNTTDDEHAVFRFHFSGHVRVEPAVRCVDVARLQRAAKGPEHSTPCRRDDAIEGRGV
jgi:hypothetical protein